MNRHDRRAFRLPKRPKNQVVSDRPDMICAACGEVCKEQFGGRSPGGEIVEGCEKCQPEYARWMRQMFDIYRDEG